MLLNRTYYYLKPFLPWRIRIGLRRLRARHNRMAYADVWPIDPNAGAIPPNWPGWPEGKRFALVLTHDVEGKKGLDRVEQVMNLESRHGFRSSFNFVPKDKHVVSDALRQTVDQAGFEVGVHGLEHDGKLYNSKREFTTKAARIREYLQKWGASGFRSPLMQHRLGWLHDLGIQYDASTFDTDCFEPQPDGAGTIFPFWVPGPSGSGYVELPYTLVQDFTLFVILRERTIDIWKQKLDWIAARGGMVLLNTHPDYMCFNGDQQQDEFPVSYYEEFLSFVQEKYEGQFWSALPREVARYYCAALPVSSRNTRKKVCMLAYTAYERDSRVRRYAETLAKRGDQVDAIALGGKDLPTCPQEINGVTVYRTQHRDTNEPHRLAYAWRWFRFLLGSSVLLTRLHHRNRYDLIHVHNMPNVLVYAAWYPKLTGVRLILDVHDLMPELFSSKFNTRSSNLYVAVLRFFEKTTAAFVDHVIVSNDLWRGTLVSRSVLENKCSVLVNHVDPDIFYRRPRTRSDGKFIVLFPGSFQWHQGLDIAIKAFVQVISQAPNAELHLYGSGPMQASLEGLAGALGLSGIVKFFGNVSLEEIANVIANSDLGVVPKRADSFGNEAYSTKIMEFMSQGIPVVASRTKIDSFYYDENTVHFFTSGDSEALANAILDVIRDQKLRETLIANGYKYAELNDWSRRKNDYLELIDMLSTEMVENKLPTACDTGVARNGQEKSAERQLEMRRGYEPPVGWEKKYEPRNGEVG